MRVLSDKALLSIIDVEYFVLSCVLTTQSQVDSLPVEYIVMEKVSVVVTLDTLVTQQEACTNYAVQYFLTKLWYKLVCGIVEVGSEELLLLTLVCLQFHLRTLRTHPHLLHSTARRHPPTSHSSSRPPLPHMAHHLRNMAWLHNQAMQVYNEATQVRN